jgi:hypothetical protein
MRRVDADDSRPSTTLSCRELPPGRPFKWRLLLDWPPGPTRPPPSNVGWNYHAKMQARGCLWRQVRVFHHRLRLCPTCSKVSLSIRIFQVVPILDLVQAFGQCGFYLELICGALLNGRAKQARTGGCEFSLAFILDEGDRVPHHPPRYLPQAAASA